MPEANVHILLPQTATAGQVCCSTVSDNNRQHYIAYALIQA